MAETSDQTPPSGLSQFLDRVGRLTVAGIEEVGNGGVMVAQSLYWLFCGFCYKQPVRMNAVIQQMMEIGISAIPIIALLAGSISTTLAIQGIYTLRIFGAEGHVTAGLAFIVVREFAPMITGILVAGRSGSALAARIGTMKINQEIDALKVMGIDPVRYLVAPPLIAMVIMVPCLSMMSSVVGLYLAGVYINLELGISLAAYFDQILNILTVEDVLHGLGKSVIYAIEIAVIGVVNGAGVQGGAEGVGKATTRSVVQSISAIIITAMVVVILSTL
jgi:phospholipid/cholesterol/gamma-HCH transport system permease protein